MSPFVPFIKKRFTFIIIHHHASSIIIIHQHTSYIISHHHTSCIITHHTSYISAHHLSSSHIIICSKIRPKKRTLWRPYEPRASGPKSPWNPRIGMRSGRERLQRPEGTRKVLVQGTSLNGVHLQAQR